MNTRLTVLRKKRTDWIITWQHNKVRWILFYYLVGLIVSCLLAFIEEVFFPLPVRYLYKALTVLVVIPCATVLVSIALTSRKTLANPHNPIHRPGNPTHNNFLKRHEQPFLALLMYIQLKEAFGWDAFKEVFAEYRRLPKAQRPKTDADKRDQWMVRFSRAVGKNLGPFFQAWAVPTSAQARASIANLPTWLPEGFPPK